MVKVNLKKMIEVDGKQYFGGAYFVDEDTAAALEKKGATVNRQPPKIEEPIIVKSKLKATAKSNKKSIKKEGK